MTRYFTQWEADDIGATIAGWTTRNGTPARVPAYSSPDIVAVKRRYLALSAPSANVAVVSWDAIDADANRAAFDIVTSFAFDLLTAADPMIYARGIAFTDWYRLNIFPGSGITIDKSVASVVTFTIGTASVTFSAGHNYFVRFRGNGTTLQARVWDAALGMAEEPTTWNISITDASLAGAGWLGLGTYHASIANVSPFNFFSVGTNGDAAVAPRSNGEYSAWLNTTAERRFLVEIKATGYDAGTADFTTPRNFYIANGGYTSKAWDTPAGQHYDGWITKIPTFRREMNLALSGKADVGFGSLVVSNPRQTTGSGGVRDDWLRMSWKREYVKEYLGDPSWPKHDFRLVLLGTLGQPSASGSSITFGVGDLLDILGLKFQTNKIAAGPFINQREPIVKGSPSVVEAVVIDQTALYFQLNDGPLAAIGHVYDNGINLTRNYAFAAGPYPGPQSLTSDAATDRLDVGSPHGMGVGYTVEWTGDISPLPAPFVVGVPYYVATIPTASTFQLSATRGGAVIDITTSVTANAMIRGWWNDLANGGFWLATSPAGRIFASAIGEKDPVGAATAASYPAAIIDQIVFDKYGLSREFKDTASFDALAASFQPISGMVLYDEDLSGLEVLHRYATGVNVWYGFTPDGLLQVGRIDLPLTVSAMDFEEHDVRDLVLEQVYLPIDRPNLVLHYNRKFPMSGGMLAAVGPTVNETFLREYDTLLGDAWGAAGVPLDDHPDVSQVVDYPDFESLITSPAADEKTRLQNFYAKKLGKYSFRTRLRASELKIGATIQLRHSRLGWKVWTSVDPASPENPATIDSTKAVVLGIDTNMSATDPFSVRLTVFRQIPQYAQWDFLISALTSVKYRIDAGKIIGVADGGAIAASDVVDQSLSVRGAFTARVNLTYRANAGNGKPAIEFNGVDSYGRSPSFAMSQPATVFAVVKQLATGGTGRLWDGNSVNQWVLNQVGAVGKISPLNLQDGAANVPLDDTVDVGFVSMVEGVYNGASSTIRANENNSKTGNPGAGGLSTGFIFGAAGALNAGFFSNYQLLEFIVADSTLSASEKANIRAYLRIKHALVTRSLVVCDGNSLTQGTGSSGGNTYPNQLLALLGGAAAYRVVNKGVGGQTTQQMTADATTDIDTKRDNWVRPILCALEIGNDIVINGLTGAAAEANYNTYCTGRRATGLKIVAMTVFARGALTGPQETARLAANVLVLANWATYADAVADLAADARLSDYTNLTYFDADQVHLNNAGYAVVAELVYNAMATIP